MRKRLLPLLLLPCLLLTGCWQDAAIVEEEPYPDDITPQKEEVVPLPEALSLPWHNGVTLDPITCPDGAQQTVAALLYEGLYALDPSFTPHPRLCESAQCNDDATVWTLTLRQNVRFSDGSALRPRDVTASLQRAKASDRYGARLSAVTSVSESQGRVVIRLSRPNASLPALLDIPIVKSGTQENAVPTGTGPYVLSSDENGSFLAANPNWRLGNALPTETIRLVDCGDESSVRYQFSSHGVQLLVSDQTGTSPLRSGSRYDIAEVDTTILHCLLLNGKTALLQSAAVRRCLSLGIDRESLVSACLSGHGRAAQFPVSPASPLYPEDLEEPYRYEDFEDALDRAGLNTGEERPLTLLVCSDSQFKSAAASYLAAALSVCDLRVTVRAMPWADYVAALERGDFDLCYAAVKLSADWDITALVTPGGALNYGGFDSAALTERLTATAQNGTASAVSAFCRQVRQQSPFLPLCFESRSVLTQQGVFEGLTPTASDPFYDLGAWQLHLAG